jgi:hypothetical protein
MIDWNRWKNKAINKIFKGKHKKNFYGKIEILH